MPKKVMPKKVMPKKVMPKKVMPKKVMPKEAMPKEAMPKKESRKISLFDYLSKQPYGSTVPILYLPDYDVVELQARNYYSDKIKKMTVTAETMLYYAFLKDNPYKKVDKQLYLVGTRPTRHFLLTFEGKEDLDRGLSTMQKYSKLYSNKQLGCEGILVDEEISEYLPTGRIESNMHGYDEGFWTGIRFGAVRRPAYLHAPEFGIHYLQLQEYGSCAGFVAGIKRLITGDFSWSPSYYRFRWTKLPIVKFEQGQFEHEKGQWVSDSIKWTYGMLPLVRIPNDILVDEAKILEKEPSQLYRP